MKAEDVGLSSDLQFFNPSNVVKGTPPRVTYTTIYKCTNFSVSHTQLISISNFFFLFIT